jgi:ubiquinone/menaquinone biosynthesis C-methylase UbiE
MSASTSSLPTSTVKFDGKIPELYDQGHGNYVMEPSAKEFMKRVQEILPAHIFTEPIKILELACGTGRLTKELVNIFPNASITATDLSPHMVAYAQTCVVRNESSSQNLVWEVADIQALPYLEETFDVIFCQYGYMFCPDKVKAFQESYRVLKHDNRVLNKVFALVWDSIESHPLLYPLYEHVTTHYPTISTAFLQTPCNMCDREITSKLLQDANFQDVVISSLSIYTGYPSKKDALHSMIQGTPLANSLKQDGIDLIQFEENAKNVYNRYEQVSGNKGSVLELEVDLHAILVYGTKQ